MAGICGKGLRPLLIACACSCAGSGTLDGTFDAARTALWRGDSARALTLAEAGAAQAGASRDARDPVRFSLLRAEILLVRGNADAAEPLIAAPIPDTPAFAALRARQRYLDGYRQVIRGQLEPAMTALDAAADLAENARAPDVRFDVDGLAGQVLFRLGRWNDGEARLAATRARAEQVGDRYHEAIALTNLGMGRLRRGQYDRALGFLDPVLALKDLEPQLVYAAALTNAGICYAQLGDFDNAIAVQERAVAAHEPRGIPLYLEQALGELGNSYLLKGDAERGISYYERAYKVSLDAGLIGDAARHAANMAAAHIERGRWDVAARLNDESATLRTQAKAANPLSHTINEAAIAAGRGDADKAIALYRSVLQASSGQPSVEWDANAALAGVLLTKGQKADALRYFDRALTVIAKTRADLLIGPELKFTFPARVARFYQRYVDVLIDLGQPARALEVAEASRARVLAERLRSGELTSTAGAQTFVDLARRGQLTFVSYWLAPLRSFAWVVTGQRITHFVLPPASEIETRALQYRQFVEQSLADPLASPSSPGDTLARSILMPVMSALPAGGSIVIVPDGALHRINFEMLPVGSPRHYWIEDATIAIAPSLGLLAAKMPPSPADKRPWLVIGNAVATSDAPALAFAREEMDRVANAAPPAPVVLQREAASPQAYLDAHPETFAVIHFAAHATVNAANPLESAVELSPVRGVRKLYARDVADARLDADLVTISACRSAGSRTYSGEGLVGFAWAFQRAGARRVIAGLWDVDDRSTASLMTTLYTRLAAGETPAAALRAAKLDLMRRGGNFAKPYYWAPFQIFTVTP